MCYYFYFLSIFGVYGTGDKIWVFEYTKIKSCRVNTPLALSVSFYLGILTGVRGYTSM